MFDSTNKLSILYVLNSGMKKYSFVLLTIVLLLSACNTSSEKNKAIKETMSATERKEASMDYFHTMRSFPESNYNQQIILDAIAETKSQVSAKTFDGTWTQQGPTNIGGRINSLAVSPTDTETMFIGLSHGGIYGTTNGGISWTQVFAGQADQSISEIVYDPNNASKIWVGTGDKSVPFTAFTGTGVYQSVDSGNSWESKGLTETGIISKIVVDPNNSNTIYAASLGVPTIKNNQRGLYKSVDGGNTWAQSLFVNDSTGVLDVHLSAQNPNVLYASSWTRIRTNRKSLITSTENKIFKSVDAGATWQQLSNGLPTGVFSKVFLTVAPNNADKLYAVYLNTEFDLHAIYTSNDGGTSWSEYNTEVPFYNFGWYFDKIIVDPQDEDNLFILNVNVHKLNNGVGYSFYDSNYHSDCHDLHFLNGNQALLATDGGLYKTNDVYSSTAAWVKIDNVPSTQYYHVVHKPQDPTVYVGGAQDNNMSEGSVHAPAAWNRFGIGDGFQPWFFATRDEYFAESQFGNIRFYANGQITSTGNFGTRVGEGTSWDTPYTVDEDLIMHVGAQSIYRADWKAAITTDDVSVDFVNFEKISPQLTDPNEPYHSSAHVISSVDKVGNTILAGTGDSRVWISTDNGDNWERVDLNGLPERYIKAVRISESDPQALFVCHSGYKDNDDTPHIYHSPDAGQSWIPISGNLPNVGINDLALVGNNNNQSIVVGTDIGVYGTIDQGISWSRLGDDLGFVPVFDVHYNPAEQEIAAATFGNSILTFPAEFFISNDVSIADRLEIQADISLSPNPSRGALQVQNSEEIQISIYNIEGKLILDQTIPTGGQFLSLTKLNAGTYLVVAKQKEKVIFSERWLKH